MQEPAGGPNHGRRASTNPEVEGRHLALGADEAQAAEFMRAGGWTVGTHKDGAERTGMSAHRGVLHPDEHVDHEAVLAAVEAELGFTHAEVHSVYRRGRFSPEALELRARIDARLLALSLAGTNLALLGRVLGFHVNEAGACEALNNAMARARKGAR